MEQREDKKDVREKTLKEEIRQHKKPLEGSFKMDKELTKEKEDKILQQRDELLEELKSLVSMCKSIGTFKNGIKYWGQDEGEILADRRIKSAERVIVKIQEEIKDE